MPTPHKHAALIKQWADDRTIGVWLWDGINWVEPLNHRSPLWMESVPHAVGPKPTQPPRKMCSLAGVEFPIVEIAALANNTVYWSAHVVQAHASRWFSDATDKERLAAGIVHLSQKAAEQHSKALLVANKQAIEGAK
jgi:hypothetical protein